MFPGRAPYNRAEGKIGQAPKQRIEAMKAMTKTLAMLVAAAVLGLAQPTAARAAEAHHAGYVALGLASLFLVGASHALAAGDHHGKPYYNAPRRRHFRPLARHRGPGFGQGHRGRGHGFRPQRGPCHPVSKIVHDAYGQPLKIAGTMCYDAYGRSYVVPGSRYVVHRW
jgi:hypothetical protein